MILRLFVYNSNLDVTNEITIVTASDNVVLDDCIAYKCGNIVNLLIHFHPSSKITFNDSPITFRFALNKYKPVVGINAAAYTGTYAAIGFIDSNGNISVRMTESQGYIDKNYDISMRFSYIAV